MPAPVFLSAAVALSLASSPPALSPDVSAWLKDRAEEYQAALRRGARDGGAPLLWRERPRDFRVPDFSPPTSLAPLVRSVRPVVVNLSAVGANPKDPSKPAAPRPQGSGFLISPD